MRAQTGNAVEAPADVATFHMRDGTQDFAVFSDVITNNQYRLPDNLPPDSVVIDVGANIGAFAVACLMRGAGTVVCFEPDPENFKVLMENVKAWTDRVACFQAAVWRSDWSDKVEFVGDRKATACGGVLLPGVKALGGDFRIEVPSMGLDDIMFHVTDGDKRRIYILKIDAEGSEYPILYTSKHLHCVDQLLVETHECTTIWPNDHVRIAGYTCDVACADGMAKFLTEQGFNFVREAESRQNSVCNLFFARRR